MKLRGNDLQRLGAEESGVPMGSEGREGGGIGRPEELIGGVEGRARLLREVLVGEQGQGSSRLDADGRERSSWPLRGRVEESTDEQEPMRPARPERDERSGSGPGRLVRWRDVSERRGGPRSRKAARSVVRGETETPPRRFRQRGSAAGRAGGRLLQARTGRTMPSRSALRRTRSPWASSIDEEVGSSHLIPRDRARSSASLFSESKLPGELVDPNLFCQLRASLLGVTQTCASTVMSARTPTPYPRTPSGGVVPGSHAL